MNERRGGVPTESNLAIQHVDDLREAYRVDGTAVTCMDGWVDCAVS